MKNNKKQYFLALCFFAASIFANNAIAMDYDEDKEITDWSGKTYDSDQFHDYFEEDLLFHPYPESFYILHKKFNCEKQELHEKLKIEQRREANEPAEAWADYEKARDASGELRQSREEIELHDKWIDCIRRQNDLDALVVNFSDYKKKNDKL